MVLIRFARTVKFVGYDAHSKVLRYSQSISVSRILIDSAITVAIIIKPLPPVGRAVWIVFPHRLQPVQRVIVIELRKRRADARNIDILLLQIAVILRAVA